MRFTVTSDGFVITHRAAGLRGYWPEVLLLTLLVVSGLRAVHWSTATSMAFVLVAVAVARRTRVAVGADGISWRTIHTRHIAWADIEEIVLDWSRNQVRATTSGGPVEIAVKLPEDPAYRRHMQAVLAQRVDAVRDVPAGWSPSSPPAVLQPDGERAGPVR